MSVFNDDIIEIHKPITLAANDGLSGSSDDDTDFDFYKEENDDEIEADFYNAENESKGNIASNTDSTRKIIKEQEKDNSNVLAILALIFSILGLLTSCILIGLVFGIAGLILAIIAYKQEQNKKVCISSFVCSGLAILLGIIMIIAIILTPTEPQNSKPESQSITVEKMEE